MAKHERETDRFEAFDSEGKSFTIIESTEFIDSSPGKTTRGLKRYKTPDGTAVKRISRSDDYEIMDAFKTIRVKRVRKV